MKRRSRKIGKIASIAAAEERRLGQITGRSRKHLEEQLDRLGELNAFRHDYAEKSQARSALNSAHWQDYQRFLHRLDNALKAQQQIVQESERTLETHRQRWIAARQRLESLERVLEKCEAEQRMYEARLEQKRMDELPVSKSSFSDDE